MVVQTIIGAETYNLRMILCKLSLESSKYLLNDGAKFYRKYKLCLHSLTIERSTNKTLKIRFYKVQLLKSY